MTDWFDSQEFPTRATTSLLKIQVHQQYKKTSGKLYLHFSANFADN